MTTIDLPAIETTTTTTEYVRKPRTDVRRVPLSRLPQVELRKMFDTRSGFWLMASIVIVALLATVGVILFAPDSELAYSTYAQAIRFPVAVILPLIAILSITSEWSQRSGLTTFTLVPHRSRASWPRRSHRLLLGSSRSCWLSRSRSSATWRGRP